MNLGHLWRRRSSNSIKKIELNELTHMVVIFNRMELQNVSKHSFIASIEKEEEEKHLAFWCFLRSDLIFYLRCQPINHVNKQSAHKLEKCCFVFSIKNHKYYYIMQSLHNQLITKLLIFLISIQSYQRVNMYISVSKFITHIWTWQLSPRKVYRHNKIMATEFCSVILDIKLFFDNRVTCLVKIGKSNELSINISRTIVYLLKYVEYVKLG